MTLRIKRVHTLTELDDLESTWKDLERIDGGPSIFQSWLWNRTWCDHVLPTLKHSRLDVRIVEDGIGRILAILPFFEQALIGGLVRLIQFLGHRLSFHNDILLANPKSAELAGEVATVLLSSLGPRTVIHLRHLNGESMFTKQLVEKQLAEPQCARLWLEANPAIRDQRERLSRTGRKNLRRRENILRRDFEIEFHVRTGRDFSKAFDELISLHHLRFASTKRKSLLIGPNLRFLKAVTSRLSHKGIFEVVQFKANGRTIAAALRTIDRDRYFAIQSGFNPKFARFSPMRRLTAETIRRGFDDLGCKIYDFGPGYDAHKYEWSPVVGRNYFCCRGGAGSLGKLAAVLYRNGFRRHLPSIPPAGKYGDTNKHHIESYTNEPRNPSKERY